MKQTEISKARGWWKHLLLLCVTLLGAIGFATAQNYPFPQNYQYPYGTIYTASGTTVKDKIQSLYEAWKNNYYVTSGNLGRVKFTQEGEDGSASVSEGIAYGMLIFVYMDNGTNNTQEDFDRLWRYYKKWENNNGLMHWKVKEFGSTVIDPNGATDADLDAAQALLMAHKQWGSNGSINYLNEAKTLINAIWNHEVNSARHLKPGDMFDDYKNPCYFITNAMQLFAYVEGKEGWQTHSWSSVISNCYSLIKKTRNGSTGLVPDWCYENGSYLTGLTNGKFESIFGYDAVRVPWRMAHAYAWYGHQDAYDIAKTIVEWAQSKYPNPDDIVDGYRLNGTPGTGLGGSLATWGTGKNACFKGGISMASMIDSKYDSYMTKSWSVGSATDQWGKYYTHTTQLLFMLCMTGNMPNFWDMLPVPDAAETNADGNAVYVDFSKAIASGVTASEWTVKTYADNDDATATSITPSKVTVNGKRITLTLPSEISEPIITVTYNGTSVKSSDDGSKADKFADFPVTDKITNMEPYVTARYTNTVATTIYVQWSKDIKISGASASDFTVYVDGSSKGSPESIAISDDGDDILELTFTNAIVGASSAEITLSYAGGTITSLTGTKAAKAFTKSMVQNYYLTVTCFDMLNAATGKNIGFAGTWAGAGSFVSETFQGQPVYSWSNKSTAYANLQTYPGDSQGMSSSDLADFQDYTSKSGLRLKGRVYLKENSGGDIMLQLNDMTDYNASFASVPLGLTVGEWKEFDINLGEVVENYQTYNPSFTYTGAKIRYVSDADNGSTKNYTIYIDYLQLCPPNPSVDMLGGKVSYDGNQVELRFSIGMRVPDKNSYSAITISDNFQDYTISSIETKVGDASTLVLTLSEPISGTDVTASYSKGYGALISVDGRECEDAYLTLANLVGLTTSTGWYDDFDDAEDYITYEIGGDGKIVTDVTEKANQSVLAVTQKATTSWAGALTISPSSYVIDMTNGRGKVSFKVATASGTMNGYYRVGLKDYFGNETHNGGWLPITITTSGEEKEVTGFNFEQIDGSAVNTVLFLFTTVIDQGEDLPNDKRYIPTFYGGTLNFDYISVGKALTLKVPASITKESVGIDEDASFSATSSADGFIYVVPWQTAPQFSELEAVCADKKGVKVACTENTPVDVSLKGIGYGFFYAYAYDPVSGSLSTKREVHINDVTPPEILDCSNGNVTEDGSVAITVSENSTVYIIKASETYASKDAILDGNNYYTVNGCKGGEASTVDIESILGTFAVGDQLAFYAVDGSDNISAKSECSFTIKPEVLKIMQVYTTDDSENITAATSRDVVTVVANRPFTAAYLVLGTKAVDLATIASVADLAVTIDGVFAAELDLSEVANMPDEAAGHIYITDGESLIGPFDIEVTKGTVFLTGLQIMESTVTVNVNEKVSVKVIEEPTNATNKTLTVAESEYATFEYRYDAEKGENYIDITGVKGTGGQTIDVVVSGSTETGTVSADPFQLKVVQLPAEITVSPQAGKSASMVVGETQTLVATVSPDNADNKAVTWSMDIIFADYIDLDTETGEITAKEEIEDDGTVTITATSVADPTVKGTIAISIGAKQVESIEPEVEEVSVALGGEKTIIVNVKPADATDKTIAVSYSAEGIATAVYTEGSLKITGVAVGTTNVTLTNAKSGQDATITVTVTCPTQAPTADDVDQMQTICQGTATALTTKTDFTAKWYEAPTGGEALASAPASTVESPVAVTKYYVAKVADGCESAERLEVSMNITAKPTATITNSKLEFCATATEVPLTAEVSTNATWTATLGGADVTAEVISGSTFNPSVKGAGKYTITLSRGTEECGDTDDAEFVVTEAPEVTVTVPEKICNTDDAITLVASIDGGEWSGTNVSDGKFDPSHGSATITYTYTAGACEVVVNEVFTVTTTPQPTIEGLKTKFCKNDDAQLFSALQVPAGGSFTLDGAAADGINPSELTATEHTVAYTLTKDGCTGSKEVAVNIYDIPTVTFGDYNDKMCDNAEAQTLTATPSNGTWSGNAPAGVFNPAGLEDDVIVTYTVTDENSCKNAGEATINVVKTVAPVLEKSVYGIVVGADVPELSAEGADVKWYATEDGAAVKEGATYTPDMTTDAETEVKVYVTNTVDGCESEQEVVTIKVTDCKTEPVTIAEVDAICFGQTIPTLTATGDGESEIRWYNAKGESLGTGAEYTPAAEAITSAGSYKFFAAQYSAANTCEGVQTAVTLTVKTTPAAPSLTGNASCAGATINNLVSTDAAFWYSAEDAEAVLTDAATVKYAPEGLEATATFYARTELNGCYSDFVSVEYTINEAPAAPEVEATKACYGKNDDYIVKATASAGCTLQWYDSHDNALGNEATQKVTGVTQADVYTYYVKQRSEQNCASAAAEATLTVNELPTPKITLTETEFCSSFGESISLTADPAPSMGTGVFTINDVEATSFVPSSYAKNTVLTVGYEFTDANGCSAKASAKAVTIVDCDDSPVTDMQVSPSTVTLKAKDVTQKLSVAIITEKEGKYNQAVTWESSAPEVATVVDGVVTAVSVGEATITVSSNYTPGQSATCAVTVIFPVTSVAFSEESITIGSGQSKDMSGLVSYEPADAQVTYSWVASSGLTITSEGVVTADETLNDATGTIKVTARTADGTEKDATINVTIVAKTQLVTSITLKEGATMTLQEGATYTMGKPTVSEATDKSYTWSIDGEGAEITADGVITVTTAKSGDTFKVVATANDGSGVTGECVVTISDKIVPIESVAFDEEGVYEIFASETIDMKEFLIVGPEDATVASVEWSISGTYATIDENGVLTPNADVVNGSGLSRNVNVIVTVNSTDGKTSMKKSQTVKVNPDPLFVTSITIPENITVEEGDSYTFEEAKVLPMNADNKEYTWSIKTEGAPASINEDGVITLTDAATPGTTFVVVATAADFKAVESNECLVTVVQKTIKLTRINLGTSEINLDANGTHGIFYVEYVHETTTQKAVEVVSSSEAVVVLDNNDGSYDVVGLNGVQNATITVKSVDNPAISSTITVNVRELVKNIKVSGTQQMFVGNTINLSAQVTDATATDKSVTWSSSDENIATVSQNGVVLGKAPGMVQITATAKDGSEASGFIDISVDKISVEQLAAKDITIEIGQSEQVKTVITPSNATYTDLSYYINDSDIASIDADGLVTGLKNGETTVTITAQADGITTLIKVKVTLNRANKEELIRLIEDEVWGAYSVYNKVENGDIVIGWAKGQITPLKCNEFQNAWMDAQTVRYEEFATQEAVDAAKNRLYRAIEGMGEKIEGIELAIDDVVVINAKVYPSVVTNTVTVEADNLKSIKIVSITGKVVAQEEAAGDEIEINASKFAQGAYKVIIETEDGVTSGSFIKK